MKLTLPDGTTAEGTPEELAAFAADHASRMPVWWRDGRGPSVPAGGQCPDTELPPKWEPKAKRCPACPEGRDSSNCDLNFKCGHLP